jgi:hypothetical protein
MDERKIVKQTRLVIFNLSDGGEVQGTVFLRLHEAHHTGVQKVGELLNDDQKFIPIKKEDETLLLNKRHIVAATVPADDERDDLMCFGKQYTISIITTLGLKFNGDIFVNLPEENSRVKDYLNQSTPFLPLIQAESIMYINQKFIMTVQG